MNAKFLLIGGALLIGGIYLFKKKNEDENNAKDSDKTTEDLSNPATQKALYLKSLLNPYKTTEGIVTVKTVWKTNSANDGTIVKILNALLDVTAWTTIQSKFRALCDGEYTLLSSLQAALPDKWYKKAIEIAAAQKVITTKNVTVTLRDSEAMTGIVTKNFNANTIIGALTSTNSNEYRFINGYRDNGIVRQDIEEITGIIYANSAKLV